VNHDNLNRVAAVATTHCLTGCVIGEIAGMVIGTAIGLDDVQTMILAIVLAFFFGYGLTALPLVRAQLDFGTIVATAFAADTVSILIMEAVDNGFILAVPGAMEAGLGEALFWWPLIVGFMLAWPLSFLVNRAMISRGKGHAVAHQHH
jgi:Na+/citrate or Na+/malate symporter